MTGARAARRLLIAAFALALLPTSAGAALDATLELEFESLGRIEGGATGEGREGLIEIYGFSHEVIAPEDAASGSSGGASPHQPVVVTVDVGPTATRISQALVQREPVTSWRLDFWTPSRSGAEENYYTVVLRDARLASIRTEMVPTDTGFTLRAHLSFDYAEAETFSWETEEGDATLSSEDALAPSHVLPPAD